MNKRIIYAIIAVCAATIGVAFPQDALDDGQLSLTPPALLNNPTFRIVGTDGDPSGNTRSDVATIEIPVSVAQDLINNNLGDTGVITDNFPSDGQFTYDPDGLGPLLPIIIDQTSTVIYTPAAAPSTIGSVSIDPDSAGPLPPVIFPLGNNGTLVIDVNGDLVYDPDGLGPLAPQAPIPLPNSDWTTISFLASGTDIEGGINRQHWFLDTATASNHDIVCNDWAVGDLIAVTNPSLTLVHGIEVTDSPLFYGQGSNPASPSPFLQLNPQETVVLMRTDLPGDGWVVHSKTHFDSESDWTTEARPNADDLEGGINRRHFFLQNPATAVHSVICDDWVVGDLIAVTNASTTLYQEIEVADSPNFYGQGVIPSSPNTNLGLQPQETVVLMRTDLPGNGWVVHSKTHFDADSAEWTELLLASGNGSVDTGDNMVHHVMGSAAVSGSSWDVESSFYADNDRLIFTNDSAFLITVDENDGTIIGANHNTGNSLELLPGESVTLMREVGGLDWKIVSDNRESSSGNLTTIIEGIGTANQNFDPDAPFGAPSTIPPGASSGDTAIENSANATLYWTHNGTSFQLTDWVLKEHVNAAEFGFTPGSPLPVFAQAAADSADATGTKLYIPEGIYNPVLALDQVLITINDDLIIEGAGQGTKIICTGPTTGGDGSGMQFYGVFHYNNTSAHVAIRDMHLEGPGFALLPSGGIQTAAISNGAGLNIGIVDTGTTRGQLLVENVDIRGWGDGVSNGNTNVGYDIILNEVDCEGLFATGLEVFSKTGVEPSDELGKKRVMVNSSEFRDNSFSHHIYINPHVESHINGTLFQNATDAGIQWNTSNGLFAESHTVTNCLFRNNNTAIHTALLSNLANNRRGKLVIDNCTFIADTNPATRPNFIDVRGNTVISNCKIQTNRPPAIATAQPGDRTNNLVGNLTVTGNEIIVSNPTNNANVVVANQQGGWNNTHTGNTYECRYDPTATFTIFLTGFGRSSADAIGEDNYSITNSTGNTYVNDFAGATGVMFASAIGFGKSHYADEHYIGAFSNNTGAVNFGDGSDAGVNTYVTLEGCTFDSSRGVPIGRMRAFDMPATITWRNKINVRDCTFLGGAYVHQAAEPNNNFWSFQLGEGWGGEIVDGDVFDIIGTGLTNPGGLFPSFRATASGGAADGLNDLLINPSYDNYSLNFAAAKTVDNFFVGGGNTSGDSADRRASDASIQSGFTNWWRVFSGEVTMIHTTGNTTYTAAGNLRPKSLVARAVGTSATFVKDPLSDLWLEVD